MILYNCKFLSTLNEYSSCSVSSSRLGKCCIYNFNHSNICVVVFFLSLKNVVHVQNGIIHSRKKEGSPIFATACMELETIMLSEISQLVKDKYHVTSLITGM